MSEKKKNSEEEEFRSRQRMNEREKEERITKQLVFIRKISQICLQVVYIVSLLTNILFQKVKLVHNTKIYMMFSA